ncbi:DUF6270 domain-containing protein [Gemmobacter sp. 24YEA27]|uniref:DUF6270 domain-containing protein n=1 Tax=Gemmobacter sp. 24YEA27 TaxID=3040672 RepID=UPI0024B3974E|nr:DUF6270 domain-containing protein [Gemmobacter sp. 24YEA27]
MAQDRSVFILGSCVTRDAFELVPHGYKLAGYICRTSFGSGFAAKPFSLSLEEIDPANEMVSQFQRAMVHTDLTKALTQTLRDLPADTTIIVDLIDERFQLLEREGTIATNSVEMQRPKPLARYPDIRVIKANTDEHFALWSKGADEFAALVAEQKLRVVLNKVHWSAGDTGGGRFDATHVQTHNAHLDRMYAYLESRMAVASVSYPMPFSSDHQHKWALSPFHYTRDIYENMIGELDQITLAV